MSEACPLKPGSENRESNPFPPPRLTLKLPLGIGTMMWGTTGLDRRINGRLLSQESMAEIVEVALRNGVRFFDTAEGYGGGSCEETLDNIFHSLLPAQVLRDAPDALVATKFLPTLWRWSEASFVSAVEASNRRLGVSCCPLFFLHSPIHPRALEVWIRGACTAYRQGKIGALGLSNCNAEQVLRAEEEVRRSGCGLRIVANQILFNLCVYKSPKLQDTVRVCRELGIAVIGYSPIGQGLLSSTPLTEERLKSIRFAKMARLSVDDLAPLRAVLGEVAERRGKTLSQISVAWVAAKGCIPLVGTRTVAQLRDTLGAFVDGEVGSDGSAAPRFELTSDEVEALDKVALGNHTFEKPPWRRSLFVVFISCLMVAYKVSRFCCGRKAGS
eukprot:Rhum_TRINITY_DN25795_c0_g1::Rhum_TRINITY_DN25795_c0_g1_i1::g.182779::m.182779/K05275/E1.1.1.65; pyridoxine 4-dehydrogenase